MVSFAVFTVLQRCGRCSVMLFDSHMHPYGLKGWKERRQKQKITLLYRAFSCSCVLPQATITSLPRPTWQAKKKQLNENCHLGIMDVLLISAKI